MLSRLARLSVLPNTPFLPSVIKEAVVGEVRSIDSDDIQIANDPFALYVHLKRGHPANSLILVTHLDRPGFVLKNSHRGIALGSVGYERLGALLKKSTLPIKIFSQKGEDLGKAQITGFFFTGRTPMVDIETKRVIPVNSHGLWDLEGFRLSEDEQRILMSAADNLLPTSLTIELLVQIAKDSYRFKDIDLLVIFTLVEEVHQVSATNIARLGRTPFGELNTKSIIVVLEAMEMKSPKNSPPDYPVVNYENGVLIKINDEDVLFGANFVNEANLAEALLRQAAIKAGVPYQHTLSAGSTDAKSFSLEEVTPSLATLAIPNRHKHNIGDEGEVTYEEVYRRDCQGFLDTLLTAVELAQKNIGYSMVESLSNKLKKIGYGQNRQELEALRNKRRQRAKSYYPRLLRSHFFAENLREWLEFNFWRGFSKINY